MKGLTKWNPLHDWDPVRELEEFQNRLGSFVSRSSTHQKRDEMSATEWWPMVDILEDDQEFLIKADLPEVRREDVRVTVESNVLTIRGERRLETEERSKRYHLSERSYGVFSRSFSLPEIADGRNIRAEFKDGLLKVHLPKSDRPRMKEVEVKVE